MYLNFIIFLQIAEAVLERLRALNPMVDVKSQKVQALTDIKFSGIKILRLAYYYKTDK